MKCLQYLSALLMNGLLVTTCFAEPVSVPKSTIVIPPPPAVVTTKTTTSIDEAKEPTRLWNLQDADILSVITEVSQQTGKNFVVDPRVNGKITLISSKPLRQSEVYQVFLSVLSSIGFSAIPSGNVVKIVPNMESSEQATRVANRFAPGKGDEVVVRVIPLENVSVSQLMPILRPMLPQWSNISAYTPGNVLILVGRASNLSRLYAIVQDVDKASSNGIQVVPLHHASAPQVATVLNNLQAASRNSGDTPLVSIAVDDRSNSLLLGGPKGLRLKMRVLISQLDSPSTTPEGNTEVIYLRYLQAKTLAPLLGKIAANIVGKGTLGDSSSSVSSVNSNASGSSSATTITKETQSSFTNIQAEVNTNAVIVTAPPALMQAIKRVISKLDVRPAQVLVEAVIAEVDEANLTSLGIQWGSIPQTIAGSGTPTSYPNLGAGVIGIMPHVQLQAVLSILQNQNGVDILSTPSVVVLDNQKATIEVGKQVPIQTGSYATSNSVQTVSPFTTNDYKNVTLKLDVTPQINLGQSVRLKLDLKNDTLQNPQNPGLTPLINTSKISNSVIVNTDDVLVLGGLISNSNVENINKVPIVSSIPIIGKLFIQKTLTYEKRNLMVFIKPIIMTNPDEAMTISALKYDVARSALANFRDELTNIGDKPVETRLPPWKNKKDLPSPFETSN